MGHRHGNKKLRLAVRARMARTGESYQKALASILSARAAPSSDVARRVDLLPVRYFGVPAAIATFEIAGHLAMLVLSSEPRREPFPRSPLTALHLPSALH